MKIKVGKNKHVRPSGIVASNNGKYFYFACNVTGAETFAKPDYFEKLIKRYGSEEKLFTDFVSKKVKILRKAGFTDEQIKKSVAEGKDLMEELPSPVEVKKEKGKRGRKKKVVVDGVVEVAANDEPGQPKPQERVIYPWSNDPTYFTSPIAPFNVEDETRATCLFPARHLDDLCYGCPVHDQCKNELRCNEEDWKSGKKKRTEVVRKEIDVWNV